MKMACSFMGALKMLQITPKHIYLIAGEASGDFLGAQLMKAIKLKAPETKFSGVGGVLMKAEGLDSLFPMTDLSVMGISEVLPRLNLLIKRIKQTADNINLINPDTIVTLCCANGMGLASKAGEKNSKVP